MNRIHTRATCVVIILSFLAASVSVYAKDPRQVPEEVLPKITGAYFNSANFQAGIHSLESLGELARIHTSVNKDETLYGFAAKSDEAKFFLIGTFYSEALAQLMSGNLELATDRLKAIETQFIALQVPNSLFGFVSKTRNRIGTGKYPNEAFCDMLSFFQPFFEDYALDLSQDKLILFRAGSWLVDMSLATAAQNRLLIQEGKPQLEYFLAEMKRMDAPKGVLKALENIDAVSGKDEIDDRDVETVLKQIKKIQMILG